MPGAASAKAVGLPKATSSIRGSECLRRAAHEIVYYGEQWDVRRLNHRKTSPSTWGAWACASSPL
jgi:hypothetical protein